MTAGRRRGEGRAARLPRVLVQRHDRLMRLRLPELLEERDLMPYAVAKASAGRIDESTLYRLQRKRGRVEFFSATLLEALCDTLKCDPAELLEREKRRSRG